MTTITYAPACENCGSTCFRVFEDLLWEAEADLDTGDLNCHDKDACGEITAIYCASCGDECKQARFNQINFS